MIESPLQFYMRCAVVNNWTDEWDIIRDTFYGLAEGKIYFPLEFSRFSNRNNLVGSAYLDDEDEIWTEVFKCINKAAQTADTINLNLSALQFGCLANLESKLKLIDAVLSDKITNLKRSVVVHIHIELWNTIIFDLIDFIKNSVHTLRNLRYTFIV